MNKLFTAIAAAAFGLGLFSASASANSISPSQQDGPFQGVVIVPASASPVQEEATQHDYGFKRGKIVDFKTTQKPGSIVVITRQNRLYFVLGNGKAAMYKVATAKKGFEWKGAHEVSAKAKWPSWTPPAEMRERRPDLPAFMEGGPKNPLGARALYLGSTIYRIHGTNEPASIGKAASPVASACSTRT